MQEHFKTGSRFFAVIFIILIIAVSLPGIFKVGDLLKTHFDTAYWSERADRQVVYSPPAQMVPSPVSYDKEKHILKDQGLPTFPVISRDDAVKSGSDTFCFNMDNVFLQKVCKRISPFIVEQTAVEDAIITTFPLRYEFSEYNMAFKYLLGMKSPIEGIDLFLSQNGMLASKDILEDDCKAACYYAELAKNLNQNFLVVIEPRKIDFLDAKGQMTPDRSQSLATDRIVVQLRQNYNADIIDLRDFFREKNMTIADIFYYGDHHWKTDAALLAAEHLANYMNQHYHTDYDLRYLRKDAFLQERFKKIFIGSSAKKTGLAYSKKMEDFVVYAPLFETDFKISFWDKNLSVRTEKNGDFRILNDYEQLYRNPYLSNPYAFFTFGDKPFIRIENHNCRKTPKIAILKNSFANAIIPYLALQTSEILVYDERHLTMKKITESLIQEQPDIIIYLNSRFDAYYKENDQNF